MFRSDKTIAIVSIGTMVLSVAVMAGWLFGVPQLEKLLPWFAPMVFNAAFAFFFFSSALLVLRFSRSRFTRGLYLLFSLTGWIIGMLTLLQSLPGVDLGMDEWFVRFPRVPGLILQHPGRMALNSAICFVLLGTGFLLLALRKSLSNRIAQYFFHAVSLLAGITLVGYMNGVSIFYSLLFIGSMATHTAVTFLALSIAASLLNPSLGLAGLFTGRLTGNRLARRIFVLMVSVTVIFGFARVPFFLERKFSYELIIPLVLVGLLLACLAILWHTAKWLNCLDRRRSGAEEEVRRMNMELERRVEERSAQIQKSEARFRLLVEQASDAIYVVDSDGRFLDVNPGLCQMTGYSEEELLGMHVEDIVCKDELLSTPFRHGPVSPGEQVIRERCLVRKDGSSFMAEINVKNFQQNSNLVIARDVTERRKIEEGLRDAELLFRTLAEKSMVGVYIMQDGRFVYVNPRFAEIYGYRPEEMIGSIEAIDLIDESYRAATMERAIEQLETGSLHYEAAGRRKDGVKIWVEFYASRTVMGQRPTIIGSTIDTTHRRRAEVQIQRETTLSDTIINSLPGLFYVISEDGRYRRWNRNFERLLGYSDQEMRELNYRQIVAPEDLESVFVAITKVFSEGHAVVEAKALSRDGRQIPFIMTGIPVWYEEQRCFLGTAIDITKRVRAEEELRASEQKYKLMFENSPMPLWMIDKESMTVLDVNEATCCLYGYSHEELVGRSTLSIRPPRDRDRQMEGYRKHIGESDELGVVRHLKKDGTLMFVRITAHDILFGGQPVRVSLTTDITEQLRAEEALQRSKANLQTILTATDTAYVLFDRSLKVIEFNEKGREFAQLNCGHFPANGDPLGSYFPPERFPEMGVQAKKVLEGERFNYEIDYPGLGSGMIWYQAGLTPIVNENAKILGMLLTLTDVTERKNSELQLKKAYDRIEAQVQSVKAMAWKQSHLMRSPLANLKALAPLLSESPEPETIRHLQTELDRLDSIIHEMAQEASGQVFIE